MVKKKVTLLIICLCLAASVELLFSYSQSKNQSEISILEGILNKAREYCERLNRIALYFTCMEDVSETIYEPFRVPTFKSGWKALENNYVYDYQLIKKTETDKIEERRFLVQKNGKKATGDEKPLSTERFFFETVVFGPIGLFGYEAQIYNNYSPEKETTSLWGRMVYVINTVPRVPDKAKWQYGRAWIDKETGGILKIEWNGTSLGNYEAVLKIAEKLDAKPLIKFESQYEYEKNGIRFPSRFTVNEDYQQRSPFWGTGARVINKSKLIAIYRDYKFFTVETIVK